MWCLIGCERNGRGITGGLITVNQSELAKIHVTHIKCGEMWGSGKICRCLPFPQDKRSSLLKTYKCSACVECPLKISEGGGMGDAPLWGMSLLWGCPWGISLYGNIPWTVLMTPQVMRDVPWEYPFMGTPCIQVMGDATSRQCSLGYPFMGTFHELLSWHSGNEWCPSVGMFLWDFLLCCQETLACWIIDCSQVVMIGKRFIGFLWSWKKAVVGQQDCFCF